MTTTKKIDVFETLYDSLIDLCNDDLITKESTFLTYHITLIEIANDFKNKIKKVYANESYWIKILTIIKSNSDDTSSIIASKTIVVASKQAFVVTLKTTNVTSKTAIVASQTTTVVSTSSTDSEAINFRFDLRFKYRNDLIYFIVEDSRERFCISTSLKQKVFQLAHDQTHYNEFHKTYDRIVFLFIFINC